MRIKVLICGLLASALLLGASSIQSVEWAMGAVAVLLQLVFAYAWPRLAQSQAPWPLTVILVLSSLAATAAALFMPGISPMSHGVEVIAAGVLMVFISQVMRGADAEGRMSGSVTGVAGVVISVLGASWAAAGTASHGFAMSLLTVLALIGAGLVCMTKLPNRWTMIFGPVVAALVGAAATVLPLDVLWWQGLIIGLLAGILVASLRALALMTRSVQNLTGVTALASAMILISGATSWYTMELMSFV